jgi:hypothetical protein
MFLRFWPRRIVTAAERRGKPIRLVWFGSPLVASGRRVQPVPDCEMVRVLVLLEAILPLVLLVECCGYGGPPYVKLSRRDMMKRGILSLGLGAGAMAPAAAQALSPAQRAMEELRIKRQIDADAVLGGELADPTGRKSLSPTLALIGVLKVDLFLKAVGAILQDKQGGDLDLAQKILKLPELETKALKRSFNTYSDNIYFTLDSQRQNAYLGGGAVPSGKQTTQYLLRNEFLGHLQDLTAEVDYCVSEEGAADCDLADARRYLTLAQENMNEYLNLAQLEDIEGAAPAAQAAFKKTLASGLQSSAAAAAAAASSSTS